MSKLHKAVDEYLAMRRSLGFALRGYDTVLHDCVTFIERHGGVLMTELVLRWATHRADVSRVWWFHQLGVARGFARFWSAKDSCTEVPPLGLLPKKRKRRKPYLYTDDDVTRLIQATSTIRSSRAPLWSVTMATLVGLLAVTGMRIGEALALDDRDFDGDTKVLLVRRAKFGKTRLIPLHSTTCSALREYVRQRDHWRASTPQSPLFPSPTGKRLKYGQVHRTFGILLEHAGLPCPHDKTGPGLHDFRHRFAINTLLRWYRAGLDIERHIFSLSTYLGHSRVVDTYWYLSAAPELMGLARRRLERALGELP